MASDPAPGSRPPGDLVALDYVCTMCGGNQVIRDA
jgi:hypothetical protein